MRPEDDMDNYTEYLFNNISDSYYRFLTDVSNFLESKKKTE